MVANDGKERRSAQSLLRDGASGTSLAMGQRAFRLEKLGVTEDDLRREAAESRKPCLPGRPR